MQRRELLTSVLLATQSARAANDRAVAGRTGCGGRGRFVASKMRDAPGVDFGAVCNFVECVPSRDQPAAEIDGMEQRETL